MTDRELRLLGLGLRAGSVTVGTAAVRAALQRGEIHLLVVARDSSRRTEEKVTRLARSTGVRTVAGPKATELGNHLGRAAIQSLGIRDRHLAAGIGGGISRDR